VIWIASDQTDEETLFNLVLEAGAEDVQDDGDGFEVACAVSEYEGVRKAIADAGIAHQSAAIQRIPKNVVKLEGNDARKIIRLMEALEDLDDVQAVSANFDVPSEILAEG
jgi:transcriptional/translational regulatory protein YebC/TACO1